MNRLAIFVILFSFIFFSCNYDENKVSKNSKAQTQILDSLFNAAILNNEVPAASVLVMHKGDVVYHKAFGWKNIEKKEKLDKNDIFRIASMTKAITALGILQLVERGMIFIHDPVSKYIPEFKDPVVLLNVNPDSSFTSRPAKNEITIHHLLTHTGGIGYGFQSDTYNALVIKNGISEGFEERAITNLENAKKIAKLPLLHDPGEDWTYSLSFDVLGAVIEIVSGQPLNEYFDEHIFRPLGMNNTYFYLPEDKVHRLTRVYEYNKDKSGFIPTTYEYTEYPIQGAKMYMSGGGDLNCPVLDIGVFAQMLLNKGELNGNRIVGSRYVEMMRSRQNHHGWWNSNVGLGLSLTTKDGGAQGSRPEGSFDFGGFFDTWCWVDPENELIGVLFLQMYPGNEYKIHEKFQNITYGLLDSF